MQRLRMSVLLVLIVLVSSAAPLTPLISAHAQSGLVATVRIDLLNVRRAPRTSYPIIGQLTRDEQVTLIGRNVGASWLEVSTRFGNGWVSAQFVSVNGSIGLLPITEGLISAFAIVSAFPAISVRSGPSTDFPVLGILFIGSTIDVIGQDAKATWLQVPFGGSSGWIQSQYVTSTGNLSAVQNSADRAQPVARAVVYRLRVRAAPDLTSDVVGVMGEREYVNIIGVNRRGTFWKVQGAFGVGWVSAQYVQAIGNLGGVPVVG